MHDSILGINTLIILKEPGRHINTYFPGTLFTNHIYRPHAEGQGVIVSCLNMIRPLSHVAGHWLIDKAPNINNIFEKIFNETDVISLIGTFLKHQ